MFSVTRKAMFETNSSSTHSISIDIEDFVSDHLPVTDGVCSVHAGEFGWENEYYYDAATKASYCLTYAKHMSQSQYSTNEYSNRGKQLLDMLKKVIIKETQAEKVIFQSFPSGSYSLWGYIDHQSDYGERDACGEAFESEEKLKAFIFNPKSELHTDNDNH